MIESSVLKGSQRALSNVKGVTTFSIVKKSDREVSLPFKVKTLNIYSAWNMFFSHSHSLNLCLKQAYVWRHHSH